MKIKYVKQIKGKVIFIWRMKNQKIKWKVTTNNKEKQWKSIFQSLFSFIRICTFSLSVFSIFRWLILSKFLVMCVCVHWIRFVLRFISLIIRHLSLLVILVRLEEIDWVTQRPTDPDRDCPISDISTWTHNSRLKNVKRKKKLCSDFKAELLIFSDQIEPVDADILKHLDL